MSHRSLRNKIRWQARKVLDDIDSISEHLLYLDQLANGQSDYINETLPVIVAAVLEMRKAIDAFESNL